MSDEVSVHLYDSGTIVLPKELRTDWPLEATFSGKRTDDTLVLKLHVPDERIRLPETALLEQVALSTEIASRPDGRDVLLDRALARARCPAMAARLSLVSA